MKQAKSKEHKKSPPLEELSPSSHQPKLNPTELKL